MWFYSHKSIAFFGKVALLCLVVSRGSVRCKKPQKHDYLEFNYSGSYFAPKKMQCFLSELYLIFKKFVGNGFIFIFILFLFFVSLFLKCQLKLQ